MDTTTLEWTAGVRIRQARLTAGWSQEELATRAGINSRTIAQWEVGNNSPRLTHLMAVSNTFAAEFGWTEDDALLYFTRGKLPAAAGASQT